MAGLRLAGPQGYSGDAQRWNAALSGSRPSPGMACVAQFWGVPSPSRVGAPGGTRRYAARSHIRDSAQPIPLSLDERYAGNRESRRWARPRRDESSRRQRRRRVAKVKIPRRWSWQTVPGRRLVASGAKIATPAADISTTSRVVAFSTGSTAERNAGPPGAKPRIIALRASCSQGPSGRANPGAASASRWRPSHGRAARAPRARSARRPPSRRGAFRSG